MENKLELKVEKVEDIAKIRLAINCESVADLMTLAIYGIEALIRKSMELDPEYDDFEGVAKGLIEGVILANKLENQARKREA